MMPCVCSNRLCSVHALLYPKQAKKQTNNACSDKQMPPALLVRLQFGKHLLRDLVAKYCTTESDVCAEWLWLKFFACDNFPFDLVSVEANFSSTLPRVAGSTKIFEHMILLLASILRIKYGMKYIINMRVFGNNKMTK